MMFDRERKHQYGKSKSKKKCFCIFDIFVIHLYIYIKKCYCLTNIINQLKIRICFISKPLVFMKLPQFHMVTTLNSLWHPTNYSLVLLYPCSASLCQVAMNVLQKYFFICFFFCTKNEFLPMSSKSSSFFMSSCCVM